MSVLVFVPIKDGKATKAGLEAASYANAISGGSATAVVAGSLEGDGGIGSVGVSNVLAYSDSFKTTLKLQNLLTLRHLNLELTQLYFLQTLKVELLLLGLLSD